MSSAASAGMDQLALGCFKFTQSSDFLKNTFSLNCFCLISGLCVGSIMGSHFTLKVVPVVGVNDSLTLNRIAKKLCQWYGEV